MSRRLSKSRLIDLRQCAKRLWLQVHRPDVAQRDAGAEHRMAVGHQVGALAQRLFDPEGRGVVFDVQRDGHEVVFQASTVAISAPAAERRPLFEAGFVAGSLLAYVDALLPEPEGTGWRLVEVKSGSSVKDYYRDDLAIQVHILRTAGVALTGASVAVIDSGWTYRGHGDYRGLLIESDLLSEAVARQAEVLAWEADAQRIVGQADSPDVAVGRHCTSPNPCPFRDHCGFIDKGALPLDAASVAWLPGRKSRKLEQHLSTGVSTLHEVPDALLNMAQRRVKHATLSGAIWTDPPALRKSLNGVTWPLHFLDFESAQFAVPMWPDTRPFEQLPFQFSLHIWHNPSDGNDRIDHRGFLDLSRQDARRALAEQLLQDLGAGPGSIVAYNKTFERDVIRALAARFPDLSERLLALEPRLIDLLPITRAGYYHPLQRGSWSIKSVLPTLPGQVGYDAFEDVADGQQAIQAYREATQPGTPPERIEEIRLALLRYCRQDTMAMVALWRFLLQCAEGPRD